MLREYKLTNFKAFSETKPLLIRPITLLYGPNSSGKSSIIQSLILLKQTLDERGNSNSALVTKGSLVDLGTYNDLIHKHDRNRKLSLKFSFEINKDQLKSSSLETSETSRKIQRFLYETLLESPYFSIEIRFDQPLNSTEITLAELKLWIGNGKEELLSYVKSPDGLIVKELNKKHVFWQNWWNEYQKIVDTRFIKRVKNFLKRKDVTDISRKKIDYLISNLQSQKDRINEELAANERDLEAVELSLVKLKQREKQVDDECRAIRSDYDNKSRDVRNKISEEERITPERLTEFIESERFSDEWSEINKEAMLGLITMWKNFNEIQKPVQEKLSKIKSQVSEKERQGIEIKDLGDLLNEELDSAKNLLGIYKRIQHKSIKFALQDYQKICVSRPLLVNRFIPDQFIQQELLTDKPTEEIDVLSEIYDGYSTLNLLENTLLYCGDFLGNFLDQISYIGPFRDYPERFYVSSEKLFGQVGKTGRGISDLLRQSSTLLDNVNEELEKFSLGYKVEIAIFQEKNSCKESDIYALRLVDSFTQVGVSPLDVGFGISQILPIIVQSMSTKSRTIIIEQPEVHIHPRLQTELGRLIVRSVKELSNQFIIETHSEHLMLRLQRMIREGELKPDDISVVYVDRGEQGSKCFQIELDEEGDFVDEWPSGFFEEDFEEIFS